jgi:hypothetical protein
MRKSMERFQSVMQSLNKNLLSLNIIRENKIMTRDYCDNSKIKISKK